MRLTSIKLSGFKSFVDPTTLAMGSNLTGVVGPNGCGKSNVIDAVRWVTGESSARQLRGEALEDVIFNGSRARKPVGRAAVELKFDNSDGKLGGQYAAFSEISVKRELARESGSRYFINAARARRRDVVDLFLGTGLGGRSNYAVIEQGAVNRLIEARPEDMRQVLEEAAGISRYKERRRESEHRIRHTRDNLERLEDLISEVGQRLTTLKRQAANAEKYKQLKIDERRLQAELLALRWLAYDHEFDAAETTLRAREDTLRGAISAQREAERARDVGVEERKHAAEEASAAQAAFYDAQSRAQRIAQALAHAREIAQLRARERAEWAQRLDKLNERDTEDASAETTARRARDEHEARRVDGRARSDAARTDLEAAEQRARAAETAWEAHAGAEHNPVQRLDAERTRMRYGEQRLEQLVERRDARRNEREGLEIPSEETLEAAETEWAERRAALDAERDRGEQIGERIDTAAAAITTTEERIEAARIALGERRAELASARKLQQAVLREDDAALTDWLEHRVRGATEGIARQVRVDATWQTAAEAVLGAWLRGFCIDSIADVGATDWPDDALVLIERAGASEERAEADAQTGPGGAPSLASGLDAPGPVRAAARNVFVVADLETALARRVDLGPGQRLVTVGGCCVGPHSLITPAGEAAEHGILRREHEIARLGHEIETEQQAYEDCAAELERHREQRRELRARRRAIETDIGERRRGVATERAELDARRVQNRELTRRATELDAELAELAAQIETAVAEHTDAQDQVTALAEDARAFALERETRQAELTARREAREAARAEADRAATELGKIEAGLAESARRAEAIAARRAETARARDELSARLAAFDAEAESAPTETSVEPGEQEAALDEQRRAERGLRAARAAVEAADETTRARAEALMRAEQDGAHAREALERARIDVETADVRRSGVAEQINEQGQDPRTLAEALPEDAEPGRWTERLEAIAARVQRLGAINLAAIEEYAAETERESYLQGQRGDLAEALATIESAIEKIDRETRARFKQVFEQVNTRFSTLFPELFGGGEAGLTLAENDWLAAGVRVMARPPGKRNASIQMLSGGEKALTAVALLFALFELNPAPFCMLDEIDAPLDDANVARFCKLVQAMSPRVQFIVITHNKLTMELAEQLHGVTMAEPGVSRLVSVDIDQALDMAG